MTGWDKFLLQCLAKIYPRIQFSGRIKIFVTGTYLRKPLAIFAEK